MPAEWSPARRLGDLQTTAARTCADVGLIGVRRVMAQNLALNMAEHGDTLGGLVVAAALPEFVTQGCRGGRDRARGQSDGGEKRYSGFSGAIVTARLSNRGDRAAEVVRAYRRRRLSPEQRSAVAARLGTVRRNA